MEPTNQEQPQLHLANEQQLDGSNKSNNSSFMCRQTSTRWTPTTEQIRILKELYYNNGVRSPSAEQIQKISAKLRQYGKIEGKNVFYWFQNHKARERQKKRLTTTTATACSEIPLMQQKDPFYYNKFPTTPTNFVAGAPSSSAGMMPHAVGQFGKYGYGSMAMEKSFRDCSISQGGPMMQNFVWAGLDPYNQYQSSYTFLEKKNKYCYDHETLDDDHEDQDPEDEEDSPGLETLPLFPVHSDHHHHEGLNGNFNNMKQDSSNNYYGNWYHQPTDGNMGFSRASLELTLNSYGCMSPFSP